MLHTDGVLHPVRLKAVYESHAYCVQLQAVHDLRGLLAQGWLGCPMVVISKCQ